MNDRFSEASMELEEKNPFLCESCVTTYGHPTIEHLTGDIDTTRRTGEAEDIIDPYTIPFGD